MGFIRKPFSVATLGLVKFRSNGERKARAATSQARSHRIEARAFEARTAAGMGQQPATAPGWWWDPHNDGTICWHDGYRWHPDTRQLPPQ